MTSLYGCLQCSQNDWIGVDSFQVFFTPELDAQEQVSHDSIWSFN